MSLADRLKQMMKMRGFSQGSLAKAVNMAQSSVWKLTSGEAKGSRRLIDIAKVLGVRAEWLAHGIEPCEIPTTSFYGSIPHEGDWQSVHAWDNQTPLSHDEIEIPFLRDIEFAGGTGATTDEDYNGLKLRFSKATLRKVGASPDNVRCFPIRGNSMEPLLPDGATVGIDCGNQQIVDGKIYAINQGGLKRIKLLYRLPNQQISIRSYNKEEYPDEIAQLADIEIIGRLIWSSMLHY